MQSAPQKWSIEILVLERKVNDVTVIGQNIEIEVQEFRGQIVRIGIKAPREIPVQTTASDSDSVFVNRGRQC